MIHYTQSHIILYHNKFKSKLFYKKIITTGREAL